MSSLLKSQTLALADLLFSATAIATEHKPTSLQTS